jgi:leucyl-tRNA synthetase
VTDAICNEYGADTLRLYEMFLGPLEQAKPWIQQVFRVFWFLESCVVCISMNMHMIVTDDANKETT